MKERHQRGSMAHARRGAAGGSAAPPAGMPTRDQASANDVSSRLAQLVRDAHWTELEAQVERCMLSDRERLRQRLRRLARDRRQRPSAAPWGRLLAAMGRSIARCERRRRALPRPQVAADLPIASAQAELTTAIAAHPVVVVCGATGSGKTTQIPKLCLRLGRGADGMVGITQPRRVAARSVADRIASELGSPLGELVGYQVRFDGRVRASCHVKVMTDGILLAETQRDRELTAYDTLIIDEAHERSLNIDFLLGYLKRLVSKRPELRVVVSSATIDPDQFSRFFDGAPVVDVSGRAHPIELRYRPLDHGDGNSLDTPDAVASAVEELAQEDAGDTLVFLAGEQEIRACADRLRRLRLAGTEILPLYARLPLRQQSRVFEPHSGRRIVLATNVAETSLTVPNVRYVIDAGTARISRYSHRSSVQRLPIEPISKASAEQRKGRCGRVGPGICIRLYAEDEFAERAEFTPPEITRANLAAVLLRMRSLGIDDIEQFPFLDPPDQRYVNDGLRLLRELGALGTSGALTPLGWRLARLPLDPRVGRMLLAADELDCLADVMVIVSGLSVSDPRERPPGSESAAAAAHERFRDDQSDFMALINLWDFFQEHARKRTGRALQTLCRRNYLSLSRMREWQDVHAQLRQMARELGLRLRGRGATYARIHRALLSGLLRNVGFRASEREYGGVRDSTFLVAPTSGLHGSGCKWVVAAELVETTRLYAFQAARVRPEWVERAAGDLLRRSYFEAHWDRRRGEVMVYEQTAIYGLTVIPKRRVRFAPVSRADAREIFIRSALVDGGPDPPQELLQRHQQVIDALRTFDHKLRRPDVVTSDECVFAYYDRLLPPEVCDRASFEAWCRRAERESPRCLDMKPHDIQRRAPPGAVDRDYPDDMAVDGMVVGLRYRFAPDGVDDGVTALLPARVLSDLDPGAFEWLVPGMLNEKVTALLRLLPKALRRELVPLPAAAVEFVASGGDRSRPLHQVLAEHLRTSRGLDVHPEAWSFERLSRSLAPHLLMNFRVLGEGGEVLGAGRDLRALQRRHGAASAPAAATLRKSAPAGGALTSTWDFGELPESMLREQQGHTVRTYPAVVDRGGGVELIYLESAARATELSRAGMTRLFVLSAHRRFQRLRRELPRRDDMCLVYTLAPEPPLTAHSPDAPRPDGGRCAQLVEDIVTLVAGRAFDPAHGEIRTAEALENACQAGLKRLDDTVHDVCDLIWRILDGYRRLRQLLHEEDRRVGAEVLADVDHQLGHLVYRGFVAATDYDALSHYPRYFAALELRLHKLRRGGANDARKRATFSPMWKRFEQRARSHSERGRNDPELRHYRWMLEEYRVSLFAQELGTAYPVSRKRLDDQWRRVAP